MAVNQINKFSQVVRMLGKTNAEVAREAGFSESYATKLSSGDRNINLKVAQKLHKKYGISVKWLMFDEGDPYDNGDNSSQNAKESDSLFDTAKTEIAQIVKDKERIISLLEKHLNIAENMNEALKKENAALLDRVKKLEKENTGLTADYIKDQNK